MKLVSISAFVFLLTLSAFGNPAKANEDDGKKKSVWEVQINHVDELPAAAREMMFGDEGNGLSVGFYYEYWPSVGPTLWTTNGQFIVYESSENKMARGIETTYYYWFLDEDQWQELLGDVPVERYSVPWKYGFPVGSSVLLL